MAVVLLGRKLLFCPRDLSMMRTRFAYIVLCPIELWPIYSYGLYDYGVNIHEAI